MKRFPRSISIGAALTSLLVAASISVAGAAPPPGVPVLQNGGTGDGGPEDPGQQAARRQSAEPRGRPASAGAMNAGRLNCGDVITKNTTLTADVGPCPADGLIIGADNITLNLNGRTISGTPGPGDGNAAGIRLVDRTGVRVTGKPGNSGRTGTVKGFDAGVFINRGSANIVEKLLVQDNIGPDAGTAPTLSDGIVVFNSAKNRIATNTIINNGIYDGIGILGRGSDDNVVEGNRVEGTVPGGVESAGGTGIGIVVNNFLDVSERGHSVFRNLILSNTVVKNFGSGISSISSVDGQIIGNTIEDNGLSQLGSFEVRSAFHGIGIQRSRQAVAETRVVVKGNTINHNGIAGVYLTRGVQENVVEDNTLINNGAFGIAVLGTNNRIVNNITGNAAEVAGTFDLYDETVGCDNNEWFGNTWGPYTFPGFEGFGSYFPDCTGVGGTGPQPGLETAFG